MKKHLVLIVLTLFVSQNLFAAYVEKVKGKKVLIFLDGMKVNKGDLVYSLNATNGKKTAVLRISTVKDNKAVGQVVKGKTRTNQEIILRSEKTSSEESSSSAPSSSKGPFAIGALLGAGMDNMKIKIGSPSEIVSQTGMGLSFLGALDYQWINSISLRGLLGMEMFNVKGDANSAICAGPSKSCKTKITYISAQLWGRFHIITEGTQVWVGGGFGILHPMSKSSNALVAESISTSGMFALGGGADIALGKDMYVPIQLEYGFLPKSADATASYYAFRAGLMFRY